MSRHLKSEPRSSVCWLMLFVVLCASALLGVSPEKAYAAPDVYKGTIKDVWGIDGILLLTWGEDEDKEQTFNIQGARIVGPTGVEWKIGSLHKGDLVELEMTADGKLVREVRVLGESLAKKPMKVAR